MKTKASKVESVDQVDKTVTAKASKATKPLFRGDYGVIYDLASHETIPVDVLLRRAAKAVRKSMQRVKYDLQVLVNPNHRSNGGKSTNVAKREGWVRLTKCHNKAA